LRNGGQDSKRDRRSRKPDFPASERTNIVERTGDRQSASSGGFGPENGEQPSISRPESGVGSESNRWSASPNPARIILTGRACRMTTARRVVNGDAILRRAPLGP